MGLFDSIKKVVSGVVEGDPDKVIEGASEAVEDTKEVVEDVVSSGTAAATSTFSAATGAIADPGGTVRDAGAVLSGGITAAAGTVADSLDAAPAVVTGALSSALEGASDLKGTIESTVGAVIEPISEPIAKAAAGLTTVIQEPIETAGAVLDGVKSGAEPLLDKVGDTIEKVVEDPVDFVEKVSGGIVGGLGAADIPGAGRDALREGVIEPIVENEQFGAIADAVADPVGTVGLVGESVEGIVDRVTGEGAIDIDTDISDGEVGIHAGEAGYSVEATDDGLELGMQIEGVPDLTVNPTQIAEEAIAGAGQIGEETLDTVIGGAQDPVGTIGKVGEGAERLIDLVTGEDLIDIDTDISDGEVGIHAGEAGYSVEATDDGLELGMQMEGVPDLTVNPTQIAEETITGVGQIGEETLDTVIGGARSLGEAAEAAATTATDKAEIVGEKVGNIAEKVTDFGADKAGAVGGTVKRVVGKVRDVGTDGAEIVGEKVEKVADKVLDKVKDVAKDGVETVSETGTKVVEKVKDIAKGAVEEIGEVAAPAGEMVSDAGTAVGQQAAAVAAAGSVAATAINPVQSEADPAIEAVEGAPVASDVPMDRIGDFGSGAGEAERPLEEVRGATSGAAEAGDELGGQFSNPMDAVTDGIAPPFTEPLSDDEPNDDVGFIEEIVETVSDFVEDAVEAVGDAVEAVTDFVEDLFDGE